MQRSDCWGILQTDMRNNTPCPKLCNYSWGVTSQALTWFLSDHPARTSTKAWAIPLEQKTLCLESVGKRWHMLWSDHCVTITAPLHVAQESIISNSLLGAATSSKHIPWLIPKSSDFKNVFPRAAVSKESWPRLLAGDVELWTQRISKGYACDEKQDACLECSAESLCDFSGHLLPILFSISVLLVLFLFYLTEE